MASMAKAQTSTPARSIISVIPMGQLHPSHIDVLGACGAVLDNVGRLVLKEAQEPVDDESRDVFHDNGGFSEFLAQLNGLICRCITGLFPPNDFDQPHCRNRAEIMGADHPRRILRGGCQIRDAQGRGIAGQDDVRWTKGIKLLKNIFLEFKLLEDRLHHHHGTFDCFLHVRRTRKPGKYIVALGLRQLSFFNLFPYEFTNIVEAPVENPSFH